jgi:hypothetical protein
MSIDISWRSNFLAGIRGIEPENIEKAFEYLRQQQYSKIRGVKGSEELLSLQQTIKSLDSIQENILSWREKGLDK